MRCLFIEGIRLDNVTDISEVQRSDDQPSVSRPVKIRKLDGGKMGEADLRSLWAKLSTQDYAFDDFSRGDPRAFVLNLTDICSAHFLVDEAAYVVVRNVFRGADCNIHFVCWDRNYSFHNIMEAGRQILDWLFKDQGVMRVSGYIPVYNNLAKRFATTMGFKYEGTLRQCVKFHDKYENVDIYGLLPKEFEKRFMQ